MPPKFKFRGLIGCWLLTVTLALAQAPAPGPDLKSPVGQVGKNLEVRFLFPQGKFFKYECPVPLVLEYKNLSKKKAKFNLSWSLPQKVPSNYGQVELEAGTTKRIPLNFPPRAVGQLYSLEVNRHTLTPPLQADSSNIIAMMVSGEGTLEYLRSLAIERNPYYAPPVASPGQPTPATPVEGEYTSPKTLSKLDPSLFPEHWALLSSLDLLICYELPTLGLSPNQYQAIANWVQHGGRLLVISNGVPNEYTGTPLEDLLPLEPKETHTTGKLVRVSGPLHPDAEILVGDASSPILVSRPVMYGKVQYLTIPLLAADQWDEKQALSLWKIVFDPPNQSVAKLNRVFGTQMLTTVPEIPRTQAIWVALFIILYGLVVGPINLSILRKRDKMLWSFATVPIIAVFFAGGAYLVNRVTRPSTPIFRELGYLHLKENAVVAYSESEQILFSPFSSAYQLKFDNTTIGDIFAHYYSAFRSNREPELFEVPADGGLSTNVSLGTWDLQRLHSQCLMTLPSPIKIALKNDKKTATITSPIASHEISALIFHPKFGVTQAFELQKGTHDYNLTFTPNALPNSVTSWDEKLYPGRDILIANIQNTSAVTNPIFDPNQARLYFWSREFQSPIDVTPKVLRKQEYLVTVEFTP